MTTLQLNKKQKGRRILVSTPGMVRVDQYLKHIQVEWLEDDLERLLQRGTTTTTGLNIRHLRTPRIVFRVDILDVRLVEALKMFTRKRAFPTGKSHRIIEIAWNIFGT